jgi:hypothetical protein
LSARSDLEREASLRITNRPFLLEQVEKRPYLGKKIRVFIQCFFSLDRLPTVANEPCLLATNPGKGPLPVATHLASETWDSYKAGSPLAAVGLSLTGLPTCYLHL